MVKKKKHEKSLFSVIQPLCFHKNRKIWLQFIMYSSSLESELRSWATLDGVAWCNHIHSAHVCSEPRLQRSHSVPHGWRLPETPQIHYALDSEFIFGDCIKFFLTPTCSYMTPYRAAAHCLRSWGHSAWCLLLLSGRKCFLSPLMSASGVCSVAVILLELPAS